MSKPKAKFYVVWKGYTPGVYRTWAETSAQVNGYAGAQYKGFASEAEAREAYGGNYWSFVNKSAGTGTGTGRGAGTVSRSLEELERMGVILDSVAVDAACSGVPGPMEYQAVSVRDGKHLFHVGPLPDGTNNVGEFLAIVDALALLQEQGKTRMPIYSDSRNALLWVAQKRCGTKLEPTPRNGPIFARIDGAVKWLLSNPVTNPLLKWETAEWGEIPADFGRK